MIYTEKHVRHWNSQLRGHVRVRVDVRSALALARQMPRPEACQMAVMKCVASYEHVTLEQLRMLFGLIAQRALRELGRQSWQGWMSQ